MQGVLKIKISTLCNQRMMDKYFQSDDRMNEVLSSLFCYPNVISQVGLDDAFFLECTFEK